MKKIILLLLLLSGLLFAKNIEYMCVVEDAIFSTKQGDFSKYSIISKGFDYTKRNKTILNVTPEQMEKTFVVSDNEVLFYIGIVKNYDKPKILTFVGMEMVNGVFSRVYQDKFQIVTYAIGKTSGKNEGLGVTVKKDQHVMVITMPVPMMLKYECAPNSK